MPNAFHCIRQFEKLKSTHWYNFRHISFAKMKYMTMKIILKDFQVIPLSFCSFNYIAIVIGLLNCAEITVSAVKSIQFHSKLFVKLSHGVSLPFWYRKEPIWIKVLFVAICDNRNKSISVQLANAGTLILSSCVSKRLIFVDWNASVCGYVM